MITELVNAVDVSTLVFNETLKEKSPIFLDKVNRSINDGNIFYLTNYKNQVDFVDDVKNHMEYEKLLTPPFTNMRIVYKTHPIYTTNSGRVKVLSINIHEDGPMVVVYSFILSHEDMERIEIPIIKGDWSSGSVQFISSKISLGLSSEILMSCVLSSMYDIHKSKRIGRVTSRSILRETSKVSSKTIRVNSIVVLGSDNDRDYKHDGQPCKIEYTNRFWRMGHWRRLPGKIGKNRNGEYVVNDFTWVEETIVGDLHLPMKNQFRVSSLSR